MLAVSQSVTELVTEAMKVTKQTSARFSAFSASNFLGIAVTGEDSRRRSERQW
jgi:hypothetical protein